ncbi:MAG: hypothetical protein ACRELZ_18995 [Candidatus Rokuibacteriota bacterium]
MPARLPKALVVLGCLLASAADAVAQPPLVTWKTCSDLGCIGQVKLRATRAAREDAAGTYNFTVFSNYEIYFEDLSSSRTRKLLHMTEPDSTFLFFGVQDAQDAEALRAKYQTRVARLVILVLTSMAKGFPDGAGALPRTWDSRTVEIDRTTFEVSARRVTSDSFVFRVTGPHHVLEGDWVMTRTSPWPDSQSMAGWMAGNGVAIPAMTLGELRLLRRR